MNILALAYQIVHPDSYHQFIWRAKFCYAIVIISVCSSLFKLGFFMLFSSVCYIEGLGNVYEMLDTTISIIMIIIIIICIFMRYSAFSVTISAPKLYDAAIFRSIDTNDDAACRIIPNVCSYHIYSITFRWSKTNTYKHLHCTVTELPSNHIISFSSNRNDKNIILLHNVESICTDRLL